VCASSAGKKYCRRVLVGYVVAMTAAGGGVDGRWRQNLVLLLYCDLGSAHESG
jgi:hypothetical protein